MHTKRAFYVMSSTSIGIDLSPQLGGRIDELSPSLFPFSHPLLPLPQKSAPEIQLGGMRSAVSSRSRVWGRAPAEIESGAF